MQMQRTECERIALSFVLKKEKSIKNIVETNKKTLTIVNKVIILTT